MIRLPADCNLQDVGLDPSEVTDVTLVRQQHGHALYRLSCSHRSFMLKYFFDPAQAIEVRGYALLSRLGVPTLPVHGHTMQALLLEDLTASRVWRLATDADVQHPETGAAIACWYRALHGAGQWLLADPHAVPEFLRREEDVLDAATLVQTGEHLQLLDNSAWRLAVEHIEALKQAIRSMPTTLTYNDFHWTNLAVSRQEHPSLQAIIFDYHLLGIGMRYSDYRNVSGALSARARSAFQHAYGPVDEREAVLDAPVAVLYALHSALQWPQLPRWALELVHEVTAGLFEAKLRRALTLL